MICSSNSQKHIPIADTHGNASTSLTKLRLFFLQTIERAIGAAHSSWPWYLYAILWPIIINNYMRHHYYLLDYVHTGIDETVLTSTYFWQPHEQCCMRWERFFFTFHFLCFVFSSLDLTPPAAPKDRCLILQKCQSIKARRRTTTARTAPTAQKHRRALTPKIL